MVAQTITVAPTTDRTAAINTITDEFRDDPVCRWIWPGDDQFDAYFAPFVEAFAGAAFERGTAYVAERFGGVALWLPPGVSSDEEALAVIAEQSIDSALKEYVITNGGQWPDTLEVLVTPDENGYTYLDRRTIPLDPWKNEYMYEPPASGEPRGRVYSYGKDGQPGGEGEDADIDNWSIVEDKR